MTPTQKKHARDAGANFMLRAEAHELLWHYTQARPFRGYGVPPEQRHANDCSGYVGLVYSWMMHSAQVFISDPLGHHYDGWGWTGSLLEWLGKHGKQAPAGRYLVGDVPIYGNSLHQTEHTTVCRKAGSAASAIFSSLGTERGPQPVPLAYRNDLLGVWRHPALL